MIRAHGEEGIHFLLRYLPRAKADPARAIIFTLGLPPEVPRARDVLLARLRDSRPSVAIEAVEALRGLGIRDARDKVLALLHHRSGRVRGAVLRYMGKLFPNEAMPLLLEALHDPHFVVRESAIDELDEMGAVEVVEGIRPLLSDRHPHVRQAAETAVRNLEELATDGEHIPRVEGSQ